MSFVYEQARNIKDDELTVLKTKCPVCGKENCSRHRPELNIVALQPWTNLKLPQTVDAALEELNPLPKKGRDLSEDEAFVDELRSSLRFIVSVLFRRIQKVDIPTLVLQNILKIAIRHLHFYLEVKRKAPPDTDIQQAVLDFYDGSLHVAVRNRRCELDYLKAFVERVFPYILPIQSHKCKYDIVNNLLLIFFEKSPPQRRPEQPSPEYPVLQNFSQALSKNDSCLHLELDDILQNTEALFHFMQFLKAEASVSVLQFYLAVDEFNNQLLTPELSKKCLSQLHHELKDMYKLYCDPSAVDKIQFEEDIVLQLKESRHLLLLYFLMYFYKLLSEQEAHEHMYELLQNTFLPLFHQSDDYYKMLCGERLPTMNLPRSLSKTGKRQDSLTSKLGNRIKGVFRSNTAVTRKKHAFASNLLRVMEGDLPEDVDYAVETIDSGDITPSATNNNGIMMVEELLPTHHHVPYRLRDDRPLKDLSAWRVTIPEILTKSDPDNPKREIHYFVVEVRRVDVLENDFEASNWTIERRYPEFYVLEQKLTEFHGEFEEIHLPPKKSFRTKRKEFLESVRVSFEQYLQVNLYKFFL
ncbi:hypothetical protein LSH36_269g07049 [Paralvinella palmiformis]|uniref:Sorting nexin-14 n=1 Tax=Paralvinella palmiformis TaxID=53620 RepID=A0AAD9N4X3_9ANNE|nr:hypothetical protein LSH36_269g07049 [Paralvinella palmiformis]